MKEKKDLKQGYYFWLKPGTTELIDAHIDVADKRSRSDFVDAAVRHYCAYIDAGCAEDILSSEVIRIMKATTKDNANHIAHMLFKLCGEMALTNDLIGEMGLDLSPEEVRARRSHAYDLVRKQHGIVYLEDVLFEETE